MKYFLSFLFLVTIAVAVFAYLADNQFSECCTNLNVSDACNAAVCNYEIKFGDMLVQFASKVCGFDNDGPPYVQCAMDQRDMTDCCTKGGIGTEDDLAFCIDVCNGLVPLVNFTRYMKCNPYFHVYDDCGIQSHQLTTPNPVGKK